MQESLFKEYVDRWFDGIVLSYEETLNGDRNPQPYYHRRMLNKQFSATGKWEALQAQYNLVAADVVAMDSQLPLKKRDSLSKLSGDIPKMGVKYMLNENQMTTIETLLMEFSRGGSNAANLERRIVASIFEDVPKVIGGVWERNEKIFLEGLSTGQATVNGTTDDNVGVSVNVDFGYKDANKFGVTALWSDAANAKPIDDINRVLEKVRTDQRRVTTAKIDHATWTNLIKTQQFKEYFAGWMGFVGNANLIMTPNFDNANNFFRESLRLTFEIIERTVTTEENGNRKVVTPWSEGKVIFLENDNAGDLVYSFLAEMRRPVAGVMYQTVDDFILVSKFSKNEPLTEYTSSQARVIPVIANGDHVYQLDAKLVNA